MAAQTNKGVHTQTQRSINRKSKDKDSSSAHTLWLTSDLCKVQHWNTAAVSATRQTLTKQICRPYRKRRFQKVLCAVVYRVCCAHWTFRASKTCWLYFSPRGLLRSWLSFCYDRWSYVQYTPEAYSLCQWKAPWGEQRPNGWGLAAVTHGGFHVP